MFTLTTLLIKWNYQTPGVTDPSYSEPVFTESESNYSAQLISVFNSLYFGLFLGLIHLSSCIQNCLWEGIGLYQPAIFPLCFVWKTVKKNKNNLSFWFINCKNQCSVTCLVYTLHTFNFTFVFVLFADDTDLCGLWSGENLQKLLSMITSEITKIKKKMVWQ